MFLNRRSPFFSPKRLNRIKNIDCTTAKIAMKLFQSWADFICIPTAKIAWLVLCRTLQPHNVCMWKFLSSLMGRLQFLFLFSIIHFYEKEYFQLYLSLYYFLLIGNSNSHNLSLVHLCPNFEDFWKTILYDTMT